LFARILNTLNFAIIFSTKPVNEKYAYFPFFSSKLNAPPRGFFLGISGFCVILKFLDTSCPLKQNPSEIKQITLFW
jgi:hypothetical protein